MKDKNQLVGIMDKQKMLTKDPSEYDVITTDEMPIRLHNGRIQSKVTCLPPWIRGMHEMDGKKILEVFFYHKMKISVEVAIMKKMVDACYNEIPEFCYYPLFFGLGCREGDAEHVKDIFNRILVEENFTPDAVIDDPNKSD